MTPQEIDRLRAVIMHFISLSSIEMIRLIMAALSGKYIPIEIRDILTPEDQNLLQDISRLHDFQGGVASEILGELKITLKPSHTKYAHKQGEEAYGGNPYGYCYYLSAMWLKVHKSSFKEIVATRRPKSIFYEANQKKYISPEINLEDTRINFLKRMHAKKLIDTFTMQLMSVEKILEIRPSAIIHTYYDFLANTIHAIIAEMQKFGLEKLGVFLTSFQINHALSFVIKIKLNYISVVFYDSNDPLGDRKIALSHSQSAHDVSKIKQLISLLNSYPLLSGNCDFTLACYILDSSPYQSFHLHPQYSLEHIKDIHAKQLHCTVQLGNAPEYCREVIRLAAMPNINLNITHANQKNPPLMIATLQNHFNLVEILARNPTVNLNLQDDHGSSSLMEAIEYTFREILRILVKNKHTDLNIRDSDGMAAVHIAAQKGDEEIIRLLLAQRHRIDLNIPSIKNFSALHIAVLNKHYVIVCLFVAEPNMVINTVNQNGHTPLMLARGMGLFDLAKVIEKALVARRLPII